MATQQWYESKHDDAHQRMPLLHCGPCGRYFTSVMKTAAAKHCGGKLLFFHEGGYSALYVPFCGLAVMEELTGTQTAVVDPELEEHCMVSMEPGPGEDTVV